MDQNEVSIHPISIFAFGVLGLMMLAVASVCALTGLRFLRPPDMLVLSIAALVIELFRRFAAPNGAIPVLRSMVYSILFLGTISVYGAMASYATQRLGMPFKDEFYISIDRMMGIDWHAIAHFVDRLPILSGLLASIYHTILLQVISPAIVLSCCGAIHALRNYLLSFSIALGMTMAIAMLLPAASYMAEFDPAAFKTLKFSGATPIEHLEMLRRPGEVIIPSSLGGIIAFPSFHAAVAVLVPLSLRSYPLAFWPSAFVNALMFLSAITEGAHYVCDAVAGAMVAMLASYLSGKLLSVAAPSWSMREALPSLSRI